ncbi:MAG: hypothetical protein GF310_01845 [candidate division Zixibacteria bacterium]|nr:hypothetical protein [candidate division Zixibacteria bacterium]
MSFKTVAFIVVALFILLLITHCSEEKTILATGDSIDTTFVTIYDTVYVVDTIGPQMNSEWIRFSAYLASVDYVKENYPARSSDRFSSLDEYCDYSDGTPAGRAGFYFEHIGADTYFTRGYTFEYQFGASGFVWGAVQNSPTEKTHQYNCTLEYEGNGKWGLVEVNLIEAGSYIRDTRHD